MPVIYTAGDVMDDASALLNDANQALYNYTVQLPLLKMVMRDLDQELTLNDNPINLVGEAEIAVAIDARALSLPSNFFLPLKLMEKGDGDEFYQDMTIVSDIRSLQLSQTDVLGYWDFRRNSINFLGATTARTVQLEYWKQLDEIIDEDSLSDVGGARNVLAYKTAAKCARYIARDKERANDLELEGGISLDNLLSLGAKNNQGVRVRRKPFRISRIRQTVRIP